ncbi:peptidoglycan-binding protein [Dyadobacter beijingensis]|uniref:Peptidoglycan-binding protein n=1 Tax=Dyadobacter beijingensis TaxID=365489 RepID=A0ABQ2IAG6_9BACT|nr:L,D-transpeptidase family protein [Dyadobacter beijingensis]GGN04166.1 peptidoglycan-binding protein [Dyadobacter beijingensis]
MKKIALFLILAVAGAACRKTAEHKTEIAKRDTTITVENSFTELFIDTAALASYVSAHTLDDSLTAKLRSFYNHRNYQYAWFFPDGVAEFVPIFRSLRNDFIHYSGDSSLYNAALDKAIDSLSQLKKISPDNQLVIDTELALTEQFFRYTDRAYSGDHRINTQELNWFIPRRKLNPEVFLDSLLKNKGQNVAAYEPVNRHYNLLKEKVLQYYSITQNGEPATVDTEKKFREGDRDTLIVTLKNRLHLLGDLPGPDSTKLFDTTLTSAVKHFQQRVGQKQTGVTGPAFFKELNVPIGSRIRQMLINMERIRWMPAAPPTDYILVNIPEFTLHAYEAGKLSFDMVVVVGSEANGTVIFSGTLNQIVFSPYWNVPASILKKEVLPGIKKNPNYLARHNMEWNGGSVRQKPGKSNSLGLVKFLFPNSYSIYFHDTPSKSLFNESQRAFSHGCIRLSEPKKMAEWLLRRDSTWTSEKITAAMNAGKEKYVRLRGKNEIPVFIGYFTSWVDQHGNLQFRKDVYGHDHKMAERLFGTAEMPVAQAVDR